MKIVHSSPVLVSKTRTGKDKFWQCHVAMDWGYWYTQTSYWQTSKNGEKSIVQFSDPYQAKPKNIGKKNETTAEQQAYLEFDSIVQKQRDKGYTEEGTVSNVRPLPMLAQKFKERGDKIQWPAYVQPKYNGHRMLMRGVEAWSRGGKDIIPECIKHLVFDTKGYIIDGELILPNNVLLQETSSASKKYISGVSEQLLFIVYDVVIPDMVFSKRYEILKKLVKDAPVNVELAPTSLVQDISEVMSFHKIFTKSGLEGTMIRDDSEGYDIGHRSNQLQKLKDFVDSEFKIIEVLEGEGSYKGCARFMCITPAGKEFMCNPEGTMEYKRQLFENRKELVNKYLTIRYQELSRDLIPIFPVGVDIRDSTS